MGIVDLETMVEHLGFIDDMSGADGGLALRLAEAAEDHVNRLLGFKIADTYGGEGQEEVPPSLVRAICMLAAHWYENRETTIAGQVASPIPFGVMEIVDEYRAWEF